MGLLTVRLSKADEQTVKQLRDRGVRIADLIRNTLRKEHDEQTRKKRSSGELKKFFDGLESEFPVSAKTPALGIDIANRHEVRKHIAAKLKRGRK